MSRSRGISHSAMAVCLPGLEAMCEEELHSLGIPKTHRFRGGVNFTASDRQLYSVNMWLRTATRVLVRLARFDAFNWQEMTEGLDMADWAQYLTPGQTVRLRVSSSASRLYHTGGIADRVADHLKVNLADEDQLSSEANDAVQLLVIRVSHNQFTVSIDSSGEALYRRGYRQAVAKAPLRESVASALLIASGWSATTPLVDPFCGSGTIVIEAARAARGIAPGSGRSFGFQKWNCFAPGTWASVTGDVSGTASDASLGVALVGSDRDAGAVAAAQANAERAGVAGDVAFEQRSVSDFARPEDPWSGRAAGSSGAIVTNPPYGIRVKGGDLRNLFAGLGSTATKHLPNWRVALLATEVASAKHIGFPLEEAFATKAGAHRVHALVGTVPDPA